MTWARSWLLPWTLAGVVSAAVPQPGTIAWERCLAARPPQTRWTLPPRLHEVSGLALSADGRLWAHNDESGVLGAFDPLTGRPLGAFRLGPVLPHDDFEDIAVVGDRLYLISSSGRLYSVALPAPTTTEGVLPFQTFETGVGSFCEIEGLAHDAAARVLLLACKASRTQELRGQVAVFRWSLERRALATPDRVLIPHRDLAKGRPGKGFHPSAIAIDPKTGQWLLLASADHAYAVVEPTGRVVMAAALGQGHPQPEGLALDASGRVFVSDEGTKRHGTVTVYACR